MALRKHCCPSLFTEEHTDHCLSREAEIAALKAEVERLRSALETINAIRDNVIRTQRASWAAVVYPLVAVLNEAGVASTVTDEELAQAPVGNRLDGAVVTD